MGNSDYIIRALQPEETRLLRDFLYEAIYLPEGTPPPPRGVIDLPKLQVYIQDFGTRPDDNCLVAESSDRVIGAVWVRQMNDYGHIDEHTPSLAAFTCYFPLLAIPRERNRYPPDAGNDKPVACQRL